MKAEEEVEKKTRKLLVDLLAERLKQDLDKRFKWNKGLNRRQRRTHERKKIHREGH